MTLSRENINEMVYNKIMDRILNREWLPGSQIPSENQLTAELGVSRVSVREAIEKMVVLGILSKQRGKGTFVNGISPSSHMNNLLPFVLLEDIDVITVQEFREIIEVDSAKLCAERCDDNTIEQLEYYYKQMCELSESGKEFAYADFQFHKTIAEGTGNSILIKVISILTDMLRFQQTKTNEYLGPSGGLSEHKQILNAIKNRDPELAGIFMRRHIEITSEKIKAINMQKTSE